eukprot:COSAG06_NODE_5934_length_3200_cov_29.593035_5_plen_74_part_00
MKTQMPDDFKKLFRGQGLELRHATSRRYYCRRRQQQVKIVARRQRMARRSWRPSPSNGIMRILRCRKKTPWRR